MTLFEGRSGGPLEPPQVPPENTQDVLPPTERSQDPERSMQDLVNDSARPLTEEERKIADRDASTAGERVYAPASERVPKTVPEYGGVVEHTDTATPERQAASQSGWPEATEPSFTRVPRPSAESVTGTTGGESDTEHPQRTRWMSNVPGGRLAPVGLGWLALLVCGVGVWLWLRWRRERNKPINRFRRQARQAATQARSRAYALRDQIPELPEMPEFPDQATRPAIGLGTALLTIALVLWQQSMRRAQATEVKAKGRAVKGRAGQASQQASRFGRQAAAGVSETDWQQHLQQLRDFWDSHRIELEKVSIPKR
jgi:hypothetical protein